MRRRRTYRADTPGMDKIQGLRATADGGVCPRCDDLILKEQRIVRHRDGWIHAGCAAGQDD